jgi:hypothetical protein
MLARRTNVWKQCRITGGQPAAGGSPDELNWYDMIGRRRCLPSNGSKTWRHMPPLEGHGAKPRTALAPSRADLHVPVIQPCISLFTGLRFLPLARDPCSCCVYYSSLNAVHACMILLYAWTGFVISWIFLCPLDARRHKRMNLVVLPVFRRAMIVLFALYSLLSFQQ